MVLLLLLLLLGGLLRLVGGCLLWSLPLLLCTSCVATARIRSALLPLVRLSEGPRVGRLLPLLRSS